MPYSDLIIKMVTRTYIVFRDSAAKARKQAAKPEPPEERERQALS